MNPILTERLILREWRPEDAAPFAALNADPAVMRFVRGPIGRTQSDALIARFQEQIDREGFGILAVEEKASGRFIGMIGLHQLRPHIPIAPAVEIAWRIEEALWGQGITTEGARAMLAFGFDEIGLPEIVSYAASGNAASRRVMEKIGLRRSARDDFDHPDLAEDDPHRHHAVYRLARDVYRPLHP